MKLLEDAKEEVTSYEKGKQSKEIILIYKTETG
jgi:hypothetical protein